MKKALFVIAFSDFKDEEYFIPRGILEKQGIGCSVASNKKGQATSTAGEKVNIDFLIEETSPQNFDAVIFIGGQGCLQNLDNEKPHQLIRETIKQGKILAGICIAPVILAKAGVLSGKKAAVWSSPQNLEPIQILQANQAVFVNEKVIQDGKIITANGPAAATEFGEKILENLK